jgi:hypothetical protein
MRRADRNIDRWIIQHLFPEDFFEAGAFPASTTLFRRPDARPYLESILHIPQVLARFTRGDLYEQLMQACESLQMERSGYWFQVNVHDNCARALERWGEYPYPLGPIGPPLLYLYSLLEEHPAQEGGTSYVGILGRDRDWLLLLELELEFLIQVYGPPAFCEAVRRGLNLPELQP